MFSLRVRPRIKFYSERSITHVIECFHDTVESKEFQLDGTFLKSSIIIKIPDEIVHYWSPELQLEVSENPFKDDEFTEHPEKTIVRGFVGPKSTVWTLFMFFYIAFGALVLGGLIYGSSQQMLDMTVTGYWYGLLGGLGLFFTFVASQIGQKMGEEQTNILLKLIERSKGLCKERYGGA